ncbi:MAG: response regulator, partial [Candidatus Tumulicola sp.]
MPGILIADDDANARLLVDVVLSHAGYEVIGADSGKQCLERALKTMPALILLDLSLPDMSGPDVLRALRADPRTRAIRVALYTATPMNAALSDFMEMYDVRDTVPKPSDP